MNEAKAVAFLQELLLKTKEGKIRWRPTASEQTYVSAFGGKFGLAISGSAYLSAESLPGWVLRVDDRGREVVRIAPEEPGVLADNLENLFETVQKQALSVDDSKLDSVLAELHRL
jgi:hypothetical protein